MPGLRFEPGTPWRIVARNLDVLRRALGDDLLNAFARCFAAADRLMTILDCMTLNGEHVGVDTVRGERNLHSLACSPPD
jgi:hypothetical protein